MEENKSIEDWRNEVSDTPTATLKIQDGESKEVTFLDEGRKNLHKDFGESIVFSVKENKNDQEVMFFYVNPQNYALLKQIKGIGELTGKCVRISRTGSKKSDTRYTVEEIEKEI